MSRWLAAPALLLLALPFITLIGVTPWHGFHLAYGDWNSVATSLGLSCISIPCIVLLGTPLALWLARTTSFMRHWVEIMVLIPLLTPPLALGILLISVYGPYGAVGGIIARLGLSLTNNAGAFVLAQIYGALPYYVMSARVAFEGVPPTVEEAAKVLGAPPWQILIRLTLPLARQGLATGLAIAWVRVVGEFGIVLVFSYFPQGIPVKLYINLQNDGIDAVYSLLWLLLVVTLPFPLCCLASSRRRLKQLH
ncbi:ABC transporter permease subunit [Sodalis ligni]|uniref:molybdate ABC transporter permease subunit n=1 Tax=Sodalis ligni TaxID=2697027 RepID=UPI001BDED122|nr:ABC transporter permease subunit [Sodalis ligni]QWA11345.1 ABC transporter permease subunit [Sodalis ligni]